jgi:type II secretory pathway predicted ATPase ExeA
MSSTNLPKSSATSDLLREYGISQRAIVKATGISKSALSRLCSHGEWPKLDYRLVKTQIDTYLRSHGLTDAQMDALCESLRVRSIRHRPHVPTAQQPANPAPIPTTETVEEETMLLKNEALTPEARQHFNLPRSPFVDDVASPDDVFQTGNVRYVRAALLDCAVNHSLLAVVGESGAGKTTLAEDLEERIKADKRDVLIIRPYVLAMEANDRGGKTLKSSHIAEAIAYALDPQLKVKSSPQARFQQVHDLLKASRRSGRRHLLLIEEAHCLPLHTLKHLKRFLELKDGMQRLIGVALIGQPELRDRLGSQNAEVREVMQRCEIVELEPLDTDLDGYLKHKFARFNLKVEDVMEADATDAIRARLNYTPRGAGKGGQRSMCYPLVVNNLVCRAMNAATKAGWDKVDAQVVASC